MAYSLINWADDPTHTTPVSAANLNHMDAGIAAAARLDGSAGATAATPITQTLSGSTKVFQDFTASDGKRYQLRITTTGKLQIYNVTNAVLCAEFGPNAGQITANGNTVWTSGNDGAGSGLDADLLDGQASTAFVQVGTGNAASLPLNIIECTTLPAPGVKGRIAIKVPFSLP